MSADPIDNAALWLGPKAGLQQVIDALRRTGYTIVGPMVDQAAIVYGEIGGIEQLPRGWTDRQAPGQYRIEQTGRDTYFDYVVGPHSWKKYLFPPRLAVAAVVPLQAGWQFERPRDDPPTYAFLGVRACEIAAIRVQDRVFLEGGYVDAAYQRRRKPAFILAVNCTLAGTNCFCASMNAGPRCTEGFDLALTELENGFVIEIGSERGRSTMADCDVRPATEAERSAGVAARQRATDQQSKRMNTDGLPQLLMANLQHPRWKDVGERCLSCTNCTMVCPTCFCSSVEEVPDLNTGRIERQRQWDSCFHEEFSSLNGRPVRNEIAARYRQWLTHKLSTWHEQFGTSGCVGCGRCITWCPVGIDITEEVAALREPAL
ncbi:MAG TPA: 4Fe-4S dicluster domain-containing protein [Planctomycetaceae bacterium]|nr:4Fe-4S dicluster domain-containing protein [Planctomycetaceae bacterium]